MLYEQLTGKSFFQCETEEDMLKLMYASFIINNDIKISFNAFLNLLDDKLLIQNFTKEFESLSRFMEQFRKEEEGKEDESEEGKKEKMTMKMTDAIMTLITSNKIDPHYVLYDMELWELTLFLDSIEKDYKSDMEEKRMWAFINVMPHIDHKKCKSPEQLLPLPWTKDEKKKKAEKEIKNNMYAIQHTIGMKLNI